MADLYKRLEEYQRSGVYPFHMPGHKRQFFPEKYMDDGEGRQGTAVPYGIDITEIEGFDNLSSPKEGDVLWQMCEEAKELYGTDATFPLINGSTAGLMAAISAVAAPGDEIIIARNCHKAVYRTAELLGLVVTYIYPEYNTDSGIVSGINIEKLHELLEIHQTAKCIVITSPTYEGVILDVCQIAEAAHAYNIPLIVDEAHGAHLPFCSDEFMNLKKNTLRSSNIKRNRGGYSALHQSADIVVQSLHKTLPALTQTAVLHVTRGAEERAGISIKRVESYVHLFQTTSPSYPLLASIDTCFSACNRMVNDKIFDGYLIRLNEERKNYKKLKRLRLLDEEIAGCYGYDIGKLVFLTIGTTISGVDLVCRLREEYQLELEMGGASYAIAMTSVCDSDEGWERLRQAIFAIDETLIIEEKTEDSLILQGHDSKSQRAKELKNNIYKTERKEETPDAVMTIREAKERASAMVALERIKKQLEQDYVSASTLPLGQVYQSLISADYVMCYPPGIPLLVPGERITAGVLSEVEKAMEAGLNILGVEDGRIAVVI